MELYSDTYYIQRVQEGDTACFACLVDRYSQPVFALINRIVQNREEAEELTQDTWLKVFAHLSGFKQQSSFSTWLYRIAYNLAISATRRRRQECLPIDEAIIERVTEEDVDQWMGNGSDEESLVHLERALQLLSADDRALILLFYWHQKSIEELAEITGQKPTNVKVRLHRIRKKLYVILKGMEDE